ncbi:MAG: hypothetical protein OEY14_04825, partial [Myxococcales bacterium]|nr:hypothetical protein [Myxococcales bacterium]
MRNLMHSPWLALSSLLLFVGSTPIGQASAQDGSLVGRVRLSADTQVLRWEFVDSTSLLTLSLPAGSGALSLGYQASELMHVG